MTKLNGWKASCALFLFFFPTAFTTSAQTFSTLATFNGIDGGSPEYVSLVQGADGNFYGTTTSPSNVFRVSPEGVLASIYQFCLQPGCMDGVAPQAGLASSTDGNFYGATFSGGANGSGTVFKITPNGMLTTLYSFCVHSGCTDGSGPIGGLIQDTNRKLYGTTANGGVNGYGTIFAITPDGILTTLHSFQGSDGESPKGTMIEATDGELYGTTVAGGAPGKGTVFRITPSGKLTTLVSFNTLVGAYPNAGLIQAADGNFYGTTYSGGTAGAGNVFRMSPDGTVTNLYSFCTEPRCEDGSGPLAGLIQATDGNLYGTTAFGGDDYADCPGAGCGTIFEITPTGTLTRLHSFRLNTDGANPHGGLFQSTNGIFYGVTYTGGGGVGTVFSLDLGLACFVAFVRAAGKVGQTGGILGQGLTGTTSVMLNGIPANFTVVSDTYLTATVPPGATTGYVTVTTPTGVLTSNVPFHVIR